MAVATVIRSTDSGYAGVSGTDGSLHDQIKLALVALGWTLVDSNDTTKQSLFRNAATGGGSGRYLWFGDLASDHDADARRCAVRGYDSAVDLASMTDQIGPDPGYIVKSSALGATLRPWVIAGDDKSFWLTIQRASSDYALCYYFGETAPLTADAGAFIVTAHNTTLTGASTEVQFATSFSANSGGSNAGGFSGVFAATSQDGSSKNSQCRLTSPGIIPGTNSTNPFGNAGGTDLYGNVITGPMWLNVNLNNWEPRSILRGTVIYRCNRLDAHSTWESVLLDTVAGPARSCLHVNGATRLSGDTSTFSMAIDLGEWDDWYDQF